MSGFLARAQKRLKQLTSRKNAHRDARAAAAMPPAASRAGDDPMGGALDEAPSSSAHLGSSMHFRNVRDALEADVVDLELLRQHCWFGCPVDCRRAAWSLLLDFWPASRAPRETVITRKRTEYWDSVRRHYEAHNWDAVLETASSPHFTGVGSDAGLGSEDLQTIRQVRKDVPRTANGIALIAQPLIQQLLERILFMWAVRHPASGYVQGMNDLALPFLFVVMSDELSGDGRGDVGMLRGLDADAAAQWLTEIGPERLQTIEADTYWLTSTFIAAVQDNFTVNQTGAHAMVAKLEQVLKVTDPELTMHLDELGIHFPEFAFRWMNCFLLRELNALQGIRLWDTYLCDLTDFAELHIYMCAAMLRRWAATITRSKDFVSVMYFLQNPPIHTIDARGMEELCSSAFLLQELYRPTLGGLSQEDGRGSRSSEGPRARPA